MAKEAFEESLVDWSQRVLLHDEPFDDLRKGFEHDIQAEAANFRDTADTDWFTTRAKQQIVYGALNHYVHTRALERETQGLHQAAPGNTALDVYLGATRDLYQGAAAACGPRMEQPSHPLHEAGAYLLKTKKDLKKLGAVAAKHGKAFVGTDKSESLGAALSYAAVTNAQANVLGCIVGHAVREGLREGTLPDGAILSVRGIEEIPYWRSYANPISSLELAAMCGKEEARQYQRFMREQRKRPPVPVGWGEWFSHTLKGGSALPPMGIAACPATPPYEVDRLQAWGRCNGRMPLAPAAVDAPMTTAFFAGVPLEVPGKFSTVELQLAHGFRNADTLYEDEVCRRIITGAMDAVREQHGI